CTEESGHAKTLTCPYHCWVYKKNGDLRAARLMPDDFDKSEHGLHPVNVEVVEGLIFICLSQSPPDFHKVLDDFKPFLKPYKFENAKVAHHDRYEIKGNWKLFVQNFRECYHCGPAHPEYCSAVVGANYMEDEIRDSHWEKSKQQWEEKGLAYETVDFKPNTSHFAIRYPLREGIQSYSLDGKAVSIPMGDHTDYENGVVGFVKLPNFWLDCVSDYAWAMRITPKDARSCIIDITFLVDYNAKEGKDYSKENLTQFWDITGGQDWELIKNNQTGIESSQYRPGPYSLVEKEVSDFDAWYISELKKHFS
ncbi:MAG: SRPBCC family protein, partial [Christiangramia sp.]|nr:SRPBCC family protein [Christiangramia sp.]